MAHACGRGRGVMSLPRCSALVRAELGRAALRPDAAVLRADPAQRIGRRGLRGPSGSPPCAGIHRRKLRAMASGGTSASGGRRDIRPAVPRGRAIRAGLRAAVQRRRGPAPSRGRGRGARRRVLPSSTSRQPAVGSNEAAAGRASLAKVERRTTRLEAAGLVAEWAGGGSVPFIGCVGILSCEISRARAMMPCSDAEHASADDGEVSARRARGRTSMVAISKRGLSLPDDAPLAAAAAGSGCGWARRCFAPSPSRGCQSAITVELRRKVRQRWRPRAGRAGAGGWRAHLPVVALHDGRGALGRRVLHPLADRLAIVARLVQRAQLLARDRAGPARGRGRGAALGSGARTGGRVCGAVDAGGARSARGWGAAAPARRAGRKCPRARSDNGSGAARAGARLWARRFSGRGLLVWGNVPAKGAAVVQRRAAGGRHRTSSLCAVDRCDPRCEPLGELAKKD